MFKWIIVFVLSVLFTKVNARQQPADTTRNLKTVVVNGYYNTQPLLRSAAAVSLIDSAQLLYQPNHSLVSLVNTASGVRMEERSPGSYRLSLRGSLLRSPFGIRNIRVYVDEFPLTDAGGNTYLNLLDMSALGNIEIYKGPEASTFGANTGGAILISSPLMQANKAAIALTGGSYGLFKQSASLQQTFKKYSFNLLQAYQQSDGYRENSALSRKFIQSSHQFKYNTKGILKAFIFYSDLAYETPGGLTAAQAEQNPKMARPATLTLPGAISQQAAIYNQTFFGGISHSYNFGTKLKHIVALFASYTGFKNPFITNYEKRKENNLGIRTFLDFNNKTSGLIWHAQLGIEATTATSTISNFDNDGGVASALTAKDKLKAAQQFAFARLNLDLNQRLLIELAASLNFYDYRYQRYFPLTEAEKEKKLNTQLMPKLGASYLLNPALSLRVSVSKGYSPPTIAEIRSSDNQINNSLEPEYGWNYETGLRFKSSNNRHYVNLNLFSYQLKDAIVRRLNANDQEYFINAGGTKQFGAEIEWTTWLLRSQQNTFLKGLEWRNSYTYSRFRFDQYVNTEANYSGNKLTGVPGHVLISSLTFLFKNGAYLFAQHNYASAIPLNDANTASAKAYHLVELKAGLNKLKLKKWRGNFFIGINNLLNEKYSLGNDLNAVGGRYFNPAAGLNFYCGLSLSF